MSRVKTPQIVGPDGRAVYSDNFKTAEYTPPPHYRISHAPKRSAEYLAAEAAAQEARQEADRAAAEAKRQAAIASSAEQLKRVLPDAASRIAAACEAVADAPQRDRPRALTTALNKLAETFSIDGVAYDSHDVAWALTAACDGSKDTTTAERIQNRLIALVAKHKYARMYGDYDGLDGEWADAFMPVPISEVTQAAPDWVIPDFLPANTQGFLYGREGSFKSFLAYGWAVSVAHGLPVYGRKTTASSVVYVAAEGAGGAYRRVQAFCQTRGVEVPSNLYLFSDAPKLDDPEQAAVFMERLRELPERPRLVIIDTLSETMAGDENNSTAAKAYMRAIADIRTATGAAVLIQHHAIKATGEFRGSTVFLAKADMVIKIVRDKGAQNKYATVMCQKMKDADPFPQYRLAQEIVTLPDGGSSLVVNATTGGVVPEKHALLLEVLEDFGEEGASSGELKAACEAEGIKSATFDRILAALVKQGSVVKGEGRMGRYTLAAGDEVM